MCEGERDFSERHSLTKETFMKCLEKTGINAGLKGLFRL